MASFDAFDAKMKAKGCSEAAIAAFRRNFEQLAGGVTGMLPETDIAPVTELPAYEELSTDISKANTLLSETVVCKLNGGLGTSMGLEKAKSLLEVKEGCSFLDLIADQVVYMREKFGSNVKFMLMNSFSTSDDTKELLSKKNAALLAEDIELMQNMSPKINADDMTPASYAENPGMEWCPPGHGDIYPALVGSGKLQQLLDAGIKYMFVSNSDNLGATLDLALLNHFADSGLDFIMEVCKRTVADKKGGHLCRMKTTNGLTLRESAMCPDDDKGAFEDITVHKFFNTNNLWVNLPALKKTMEESGGVMKLPLIKNKKTVNPRDSSTMKVFQLETAMGSAIECFANAGAVCVPRSRFAPVKTCNDLFALRSDAFKVNEDRTVSLAAPAAPVVKMDDKHYKLVDKMESLCEAPPSMVDCTSLTVKGPVNFAAGVVLKGDVSIINPGETPVTLAAGVYDGATLSLKAEEPATVAA